MRAQSHLAGLAARRLTRQLPIVQEQRLLGKEECGAPHQHHPGAWADRVGVKEIKFKKYYYCYLSPTVHLQHRIMVTGVF